MFKNINFCFIIDYDGYNKIEYFLYNKGKKIMKMKVWLDDDWIYLVIGNPALSNRN